MGSKHTLPVAGIIILRKGNKVLLTRRYNTGYEDGKYTLPGGHVEKGEEIKVAMAREAKEDVGVDLNPNDLVITHVFDRKVNDDVEYIDFVVETDKWQGTPEIMEKDQCDDIIWADIDKIPDNTIQFNKDVLTKKYDFYIPYGWQDER